MSEDQMLKSLVMKILEYLTVLLVFGLISCFRLLLANQRDIRCISDTLYSYQYIVLFIYAKHTTIEENLLAIIFYL